MRKLVLVAAVLGCAGDGVEWEGIVETLPNGAVRVSNPATAAWREDRAWRLVPERAIGEAEGEEAYTFGSVSGLAVGADGRIYVLDRQSNELRIFDREGRHLRTVGRTGAGPAEYQAANGLAWLAPDSLLVIDQRGNRYSVLTADGDFVRSVPRALGFYGWAFQGAVYGGKVWEQSTVGYTMDTPGVPALLGTDLTGTVRTDTVQVADRNPPLDVVTSPARTARVDTLLLPEPAGESPGFYSVRTERAGMSMGIPHASGTVYLLDEEGTLWFGRGNDYRIVRARLEGDTLMEILSAATPAAVTSQEIDEFASSESAKRFRQMGGDLDLSRIPKHKPHFDRFFRDDTGRLWVWVPVSDTETAFDVFDGDGRYMGRLPVALRRDRYVEPVVRDGRLYVIGRDELDVQRVFVFRLEIPEEGGRTA